jgi:hypothetical protein
MLGAVPLLQSEVPALHIYEHVVATLQVAIEAFVGLHLSPHALQSLVVLSVVHTGPVGSLHVVAVQVHTPPWHVGVGCAHVVWFAQLPVGSHVCVVFPLQFVCPGAHTPLQALLTHVWLTHGDGLLHVPFMHVSSALPGTHCVCVGAHVPMHMPFMHVWLTHATGAPHAPVMSHVSTPLLAPEHCTEPGEQATHVVVLFRHTGVMPEHTVCNCQLPFMSHD